MILVKQNNLKKWELSPIGTVRIILNCNGSLLLKICDRKIKIKRKTIILIPLIFPLKIKTKTGPSIKIFELAFSENELNTGFNPEKINDLDQFKFFEPDKITAINLNTFDYLYLAALFRILYFHLNYRTAYRYYTDCKAILLYTILKELEAVSVRNRLNIRHFKSAANPLIRSFLELLLHNYKSRHNLDFYAAELSVTTDYLNKLVKKETSEAPSVIIRRFLLNRAKYLLSETNLPLKMIAEELGYSEISAFSRFFKKQLSINPGDFRKKMQQKSNQ